MTITINAAGKKTMRYNPKHGDIIAIKIRPRKFVLAKVAFLSKPHRGVLFLRVYDELFAAAEAPEVLPKAYRCQFRTIDKYIKSGRWHLVGHDPSTKGDKTASRYVTASGLFEGDKRLRDVRAADRETILPFVIYFDASAEKMLRQDFGV